MTSVNIDTSTIIMDWYDQHGLADCIYNIVQTGFILKTLSSCYLLFQPTFSQQPKKNISGMKVFLAYSCEDIPSKRKNWLWFIDFIFIIPIFCSVFMLSINLPPPGLCPIIRGLPASTSNEMLGLKPVCSNRNIL